LFRPFGKIKRVAIPKKFDNQWSLQGKSRGFGFVEFMTKADAENAKDALQNSHLYGRHLVIEFAKEEKL